MAEDNRYCYKTAINRMVAAGLQVEKTHFGFRLQYFEGSNSCIGECGMDNDMSEGLSIKCIILRKVSWFHRFSASEMAGFLIAAHDAMTPGDDFIAILTKLDATHDYDRMAERLREANPNWYSHPDK